MTMNEFKWAFEIAQSKEDLSNEDDSVFMGFALKDYKPVIATYRQLARLIRWQAWQFNGSWDNEALKEIMDCGRKRFTII